MTPGWKGGTFTGYMKRLTLFCLLGILFSSCIVQQEVFLRRSGGGKLELEVRLDDMVVSYAGDIYGSFSSDPSEVSIFNTAAVLDFFVSNPVTDLTSLENPTPGELSLTANFTDLEALLDQESYDLQPVLSVVEEDKITTVVFTLTARNMRILTDPVALTDSEMLQVFGPQADRPYTEAEYVDLISYAFEEYLDEKGAAPVLSSSGVTVRVRTDGEIVNVSGGTLKDGTAVFTIPFMDIVTLAKPIVLSVSFK